MGILKILVLVVLLVSAAVTIRQGVKEPDAKKKRMKFILGGVLGAVGVVATIYCISKGKKWMYEDS